MGIGSKLKGLRKQKNMTLKEVGEHLGMTPTAISCYESESRKPSHEIILKLADLFETDPNEILGYEHNDEYNIARMVRNKLAHWNGVPLREEELNIIKNLLEMRIKDREEEKKNQDESNVC